MPRLRVVNPHTVHQHQGLTVAGPPDRQIRDEPTR